MWLAATLVTSAAIVVEGTTHDSSHLEPDRYPPRHRNRAAAANGGPGVAYLPAFAIPDGSPVDPCVTCRPRRTTHNCRRNTGDGCPSRSSSFSGCATKRCASRSPPAGSTSKRFCPPSSPVSGSTPTKQYTRKRGQTISTRGAAKLPKDRRTGRFVSKVL